MVGGGRENLDTDVLLRFREKLLVNGRWDFYDIR